MGAPFSEPVPPAGEDLELTHIDAAGRARMVDVSTKPWTRRRAVARCRVVPGGILGDNSALLPADQRGTMIAGERLGAEVLESARLAGIQAAKQTARLIPLCHPLSSSAVHVALSPVGGEVQVEAEAEVVGPTGVEMEALTACAFAGLALLAALLPSHPSASIEELTLWEKTGGRSGTWTRAAASTSPTGGWT